MTLQTGFREWFVRGCALLVVAAISCNDGSQQSPGDRASNGGAPQATGDSSHPGGTHSPAGDSSNANRGIAPREQRYTGSLTLRTDGEASPASMSITGILRDAPAEPVFRSLLVLRGIDSGTRSTFEFQIWSTSTRIRSGTYAIGGGKASGDVKFQLQWMRPPEPLAAGTEYASLRLELTIDDDRGGGTFDIEIPGDATGKGSTATRLQGQFEMKRSK